MYCLHVKNKFKSGLYGSLMKLFLWMTVLMACLLGWVFLLMKVFDESAVPLLDNNNNNNNAERGLSSLDERQRVISEALRWNSSGRQRERSVRGDGE